MLIHLYNFNKRDNSTALPDAISTAISGELREGCSQLSPLIRVDLGDLQSYPRFNYAFLPELHRWYWIDNISYDPPFWILQLSVDVLGSWRDEILGSYQYVLRSASQSNGNIIDSLYPTIGSTTVTKQLAPWMSHSQFDWTYIVGIYGDAAQYPSAVTRGGIIYWRMNWQQMFDFASTMFGDIERYGTDFGTPVDYIKQQFNPSKYVANIIRLPYDPDPDAGVVDNLPFGWYNLPVKAGRLGLARETVVKKFQLDLPKHPQIAQRGAYLQRAPYTEYMLRIPCFGQFALDPNLLYGADRIEITFVTSSFSGSSTCYVRTLGSDAHTLVKADSNLGISVQLTQITTDKMGAFNSQIGLVNRLVNKDFVGALTSGVTDIVSASLPQVQTVGSVGDEISLSQYIVLQATFFSVADEDPVNRGRPLYARRKLSTLSGFTQIADATIEIPALADEQASIKRYMEGGVFIE